MSKPKRCDWCGKGIGAREARVKLPVMYDAPPFTYHTVCYCQVYAEDCLRAIVSGSGVGWSLSQVLGAIDPDRRDEDD